MSTPAPTPSDYAALLDGCIRAGVKLVHETCDNQAVPGQNRAQDYHLVTRSIRQSILLLARIAADANADAAQVRLGDARRAAARKQILRAGQDAIQHRARGPNAENLEAELLERLDDPGLDAEIDTRPIPDLVAEIIRDLRVVANDPNRFKRRTPDDIRALDLLAAAPTGQTAVIAAAAPRPTPEPAPESAPDSAPAWIPLPERPLSDHPDRAVATILRYESFLRDQR